MPPNLKKNNNNNPHSPTTNVKYKYDISLPLSRTSRSQQQSTTSNNKCHQQRHPTIKANNGQLLKHQNCRFSHGK